MKKRKRKSCRFSKFFVTNYSKCWEYLKESKKFIFAVIILFFLFALIGFLFQPPAIVSFILEYIDEILAKTQGLSSFEMMGFIFTNNIQSSFMAMIFGFFLGIFPVLSTIANGYVLGYVSSLAVSSFGTGSLLTLLPHGIFELPAIFISFGLGIKFGTFIFSKEKMKEFNRFFIESLRIFVFVILPLLIIAAVIEGSLI